jgi:hypothetical protein
MQNQKTKNETAPVSQNGGIETSEWEQEFRKKHPFRIMDRIGSDRRRAYRDAHAKYDPLLKKISEAQVVANEQLASFVVAMGTWDEIAQKTRVPEDIDPNDPDFQRYFAEVDRLEKEFGDTYIELQGEYEKIEDEFDRQTHEYFAKHPAINPEASPSQDFHNALRPAATASVNQRRLEIKRL